MKGITAPAQLMGIRALSDGGVSLSFHTSELSPEEKVVLMNLHMQAGWMMFKPDIQIPDEEVPVKESGFETKTPGQRLRAVLFLIWKQEGEKGTFNEFYATTMEKFITHYKSRLE
jgi:hypothetical protein